MLAAEVNVFGSQVLEVVIGLLLIYLALSVACSGIKEVIAGVFSLRSKTLENAVRNMLQNGGGLDLASKVLQHPLILRTAQPGDKPSYIAARSFSAALFDILAPSNGTQPRTIQDLRAGIATIPEPKLRQTLSSLVDGSQADLESARQKVEHWFDDTMDRVSGWYKRLAQKIIFAAALALCLALNADSVMIVKELWTDEAVRSGLISAAQSKVQSGNARQPSSGTASLQSVASEIRGANLPPIGWNTDRKDVRDFPDEVPLIALKLLGFLITSFAILLGAPFWFDLLNNVINLRLAGAPPPSSH
jgi:hypothetical protein